MNKKHFKILVVLMIICLSLISVVYATSANKNNKKNNTYKRCTHAVYSADNSNVYHYSYCNNCGRCDGRAYHNTSSPKHTGNGAYHTAYCSCGRYMGIEAHRFTSFSRYSETLHYASCGCGFSTLTSHSPTATKLNRGEIVKGRIYVSDEDLDTYHKLVCGSCGEVLGVAEHTWTRGSTLAHKCSGCAYEHSKKKDATKGLHYFNISKINILGDVAPCEVCESCLNLEFAEGSKLPTLPKKEEYTMVGNPNPMREVTISSDETIKCNYMPINEAGELIELNDEFLKVRGYTQGNYYSHYSKLAGSALSNITQRVEYVDGGLVANITNDLSALGGLGGYNIDAKNQVISNMENTVWGNENLGRIDMFAVSTVVSQLRRFCNRFN